jgi:hypothetical protein
MRRPRLTIMKLRPRDVVVTLLTVAALNGVAAGFVDKFGLCKQRVLSVLNGMDSINNITNDTIWELDLIYDGPARELDPNYPRSQYLTLTYKGE